MSTSPERLESIDALRGIAFLGVLLVHTGQSVPDFFGKQLTAAGAFGVALFFIASAFTLLASHRHRRTQEPSPTLSFFIRRIFRIVPLFWAGILFYYLIHGTWNRGWAEGSLGWFHFLSTALLLHGWHPDTINTVVPGGWSIAVEFGFYIIAPVLFVVISDGRRALLAYAIALALALGLSYFVRRGHWVGWIFPQVPEWRQASFTYLWLPFHLPTFILGFLAFFLLAPYRRLPRSFTRFCLPAVCVALVAGALWLPFRIGDFVFPVLLAAFVLMLVADPVGFLVNRATCALGVVSFSAYITHFAALEVVEKLAAKLPLRPPEARFALIFSATLVLTAAASFVTYRLIELPGIALGRKLIKQMRPRSEIPIVTHVA